MYNNSKTIDRYKMGEMDPQEKQHFEKELNFNLQLNREMKLDDDIDAMLTEDDVIDFRKQLTEIYNNDSSLFNKPIKLPVYRQKWYMAAASIALIIILSGTLYLFLPDSYSNERLFNKYYNADQVLNVSRSGNDQLFDALLKYQQKDFAEASVLFDELLITDASNITIRFYSGIASIETNQTGKAIKAFQFIIDHQDNLFVEHAIWYLGLTYLKVGSNHEAINTFRKIADDPNNYYQKKAKEILTKLHYDDS
ncbi:MAG: hypothetical protein U1C46_00495 [Bacteroidales bacterium]|nr:hypothetical protein [Bacteroidales bacterium]